MHILGVLHRHESSYYGFASELLLVLGKRMGKLAGWTAAYWMWGPIEEDNCEIDLAKDVSLSSTLPPPESPKLVVV